MLELSDKSVKAARTKMLHEQLQTFLKQMKGHKSPAKKENVSVKK